MNHILLRLFNVKRNAKIMYGQVLCPSCIATAFIEEDTPKFMTEGYCYRCGQHIKWKWEEPNE